ncbi:MAG: hypothetical protein A2675_03505 [Candidatus Yonathbacteria bacterium RIFCSPHIGHO2_01_FULL_51_10]|uniref:Uncharacterized protein n=1 Tax=Candidatus Yonathbacteria bacterium RIFCSPHIGHO2_01_FULL_51_10 TaxID=1802723 RepID=A0A1G2S927_9BACT|nr:MAG: hypothetical protein A2675_03505 [Candidatus Yonathbacteria bacterium RIFCSPHIGHO2_01_FULL_51_10]
MVSTGALLVMRGYIPAGSRMEKCEMIELVAQACAETLELLHGQQNDVIYSRIVVAKICEVLWQQNRATLVAAGSFEVLNGSTLLVFSKGEYS